MKNFVESYVISSQSTCIFTCTPFSACSVIMTAPICRMSDASLEEEDSSGELTNLPNIGIAPIPEVEAVLRTADHWHFDAFRLTEVSQGYPLSTLGFWLIQQNRVAKEFSEYTLTWCTRLAMLGHICPRSPLTPMQSSGWRAGGWGGGRGGGHIRLVHKPSLPQSPVSLL